MSEQTPIPSEAPAESGLLTGGAPPAEAPASEGKGLLTGDPAPEEKPAEGEAPVAEGEGEGEGEKPGAPEGAPEEYADFDAPEGVTFDTDIAGDLKALAKELNLPQGKAQEIANLGVKMAQKWQEDLAASWSNTVQSWVADSRKEFDAPKLATANRALETFGDSDLRDFITGGVENHPAFIRFMLKVGEAVSEDRFVAGGKASPADRPIADRLYGATAK